MNLETIFKFDKWLHTRSYYPTKNGMYQHGVFMHLRTIEELFSEFQKE